jgi:hypothetical protein
MMKFRKQKKISFSMVPKILLESGDSAPHTPNSFVPFASAKTGAGACRSIGAVKRRRANEHCQKQERRRAEIISGQIYAAFL